MYNNVFIIWQPDGIDFDEDKYDFLIHQLELFKALTYVSMKICCIFQWKYNYENKYVPFSLWLCVPGVFYGDLIVCVCVCVCVST